MATAGKTTSNWVVDIQKKVEAVDLNTEEKQWSRQAIYQVPSCIKDLNNKAYKPQVVSFGPYHNGEPQLLPMEEHKQRALVHFLKRPNNKSLEHYLGELASVEEQLRTTYQTLDKRWNDKDVFLQLMMVDGCFMLEILRVATEQSSDYAKTDPIFSNHGMLYTLPYIKRDMLMLENQLPLLVLEKLNSSNPRSTTDNPTQVNKLVLQFFGSKAQAPTTLGLHSLDLYRQSMLSGQVPRSSPQKEEPSSEIIRSAMELNEAGIRFKKNKSGSLKEITFHNGVLSLPVIVVDDATEYMFLNIMAFERLHVDAGNEVTAYVFFMDNIIDSAKDVSLLHSKGIIQNALGSDKAVAKLFNSLSKDVVLDPESSLDDVHNRVNKYCRKSWNMWRANLIHTYFRSPWAFLSLVAAIFLIVLTVAQTFYSIYPYYKPREDSSSSSPPTIFAPPPALSPQ
ncbi:hypothetical protein J5N97_021443 [Dioscorea zingiberensis]|uniref:Uncharacterized protein n=1 Tax=Dioscorea zingiberensis TaxID=325984 RepID=A0A9D5CIG6_9LILI|nr:hypothetical protein J5N97_021443 [Dioscorea zingiberensis]